MDANSRETSAENASSSDAISARHRVTSPCREMRGSSAPSLWRGWPPTPEVDIDDSDISGFNGQASDRAALVHTLRLDGSRA